MMRVRRYFWDVEQRISWGGGEIKRGGTRTRVSEVMNKNEFTEPAAAMLRQTLFATEEVGGKFESGGKDKQDRGETCIRQGGQDFKRAVEDEGKEVVNTVPKTCSLEWVVCNRLPRWLS